MKQQSLSEPQTVPSGTETIKRMLLSALGITLAAMTWYVWWFGYLPLFATYTDPATFVQMVEPAEWIVAQAPVLTTLVPVLTDGVLPVPTL